MIFRKSDEYDVIVIGGGPSGLSAAIWCADLSLSVLLLEREAELGGQLHLIHNVIANFPGLAETSGEKLKQVFSKQADRPGIEVRRGTTLTSIDLTERTIDVLDATLTARALVLATGVERRRLGVPGEAEFAGRGMLTSGVGERDRVAGRTVAIVGGGDAALENALLLSETALNVFLIHRRETFTAREEFLDRARETANIEFLADSVVQSFSGDQRLETVEITRSDGTITRLATEFALVRIGVEPRSRQFAEDLDRDREGYLVVTADCETNLPLVYAVGDLASPRSPTIATAIGMGATAAKNIESRLRRSQQ